MSRPRLARPTASIDWGISAVHDEVISLFELLGATVDSKAVLIEGNETQKEAFCGPAGASSVNDQSAQGGGGT